MLSGHERPSISGQTKQLVVILHGWGADGANLIDLADAWANVLPDAHFCAPNAHEVCEVNPYGFQWFSLMDRSPARMQAGVANAATHVNDFLDAKLRELNAGANNFYEVSRPNEPLAVPHVSDSMSRSGGIQTMLVGFSQGTMTALHVGLRRADVACVLGYSGSLLEDEVSLSKLHGTSNRRAPEALRVCLIHGEQDDVVPFAAMVRAEGLLKSAGVPVETHARPRLTHSIDMEGVEIGARFLLKSLSR